MNLPRIKVSTSILAADFSCLEREVKAAEDAGADMIHCDVMDGHFVPNITFGPLVVETVRRCVSIPLDVHLMIVDPGIYIDDFCSAGANILTVHAEVCDDIPGICSKIRAHGVRAGISVNPDKPVSLFIDKLEYIDQVLIMMVFAGFGGQKFMPGTAGKIETIFREAQKAGHSFDIEVDGGINAETAAVCARAGANVFVAGSYVFGKGKNYADRIRAVREAAIKTRRSLECKNNRASLQAEGSKSKKAKQEA